MSTHKIISSTECVRQSRYYVASEKSVVVPEHDAYFAFFCDMTDDEPAIALLTVQKTTDNPLSANNYYSLRWVWSSDSQRWRID